MGECFSMSIETTRSFLLGCIGVNYGILLLWFLAFIVAHDSLHRLHARWFRISVEQFDAVHYAGMAVYKIGILLLNLVPYLALRMVA
jgi:hypothetical protein